MIEVAPNVSYMATSSTCSPKWAIAIHGGAGVIDGGDDEANARALEGLKAAIEIGTSKRENKI